MERQSTKTDIGLTLGLLTVVICLFQLGLFLPSIKLFFQTGSMTRNTAAIPFVVMPAIFFTVLLQIGLWIVLAGFIWLNTKLNFRCLHPADKQLPYAIGLWLVAVLAIFCGNQLLFPGSLFADFTRTLLPNSLAYLVLFLCLLLLTLSMGIAIFVLCRDFGKWVLGGIVVCVAASLIMMRFVQPSPVVANAKQPNVIIIGLDSLRPDHVGFYQDRFAFTPNLDTFLKTATVFTNASTPLARTYPAWISILTGRFPKQDGARYDLIRKSQVNFAHNLPQILQQAGYTTIYASDERRFSNIDESYHFDKVIAPKLGFNDFLLGTFNDFPLGNLLIHSRLGAALFPYNHLNRAATLTYYPARFNRALFRELNSLRQRPIFLALHLCLSHFPYVWADSNPKPARNFIELRRLYQQSLMTIDKQYQSIMNFLKQNGFLEKAIVIVISDHGEALNYAGDRPLLQRQYQSKDVGNSPYMQWVKHSPNPILNQSKGHGTDVLSLSQYDIVLAIKQFGQAFAAKQWSFPVSLVDLKPTILALLNLPDQHSSGISLAPYIKAKQLAPPSDRHLFFETGFSPDLILTEKMTMENLLDLGVRYYKIDAQTGRVFFKDSMTPLIIANKQRAVRYGDWLLAYYPNGLKVLLNMKTGLWTDDLNTPFAKQSPLSKMQSALKAHYGEELS